MSAEEITSADQRKPENIKAWRLGWLLVAALIASMLFGNHEGRMANIWLLSIVGLILAALAADYVLRKRGIKS